MIQLKAEVPTFARIQLVATGCDCITRLRHRGVPCIGDRGALCEWERYAPAIHCAAVIGNYNIVEHRAAIPNICITDCAADRAAA